MKTSKEKSGISLIEVVLSIFFLSLLIVLINKLFFSEIQNIKFSVEHMYLNENVRRVMVLLGHDARKSNWVDFPAPMDVNEIKDLKPITAPGPFIKLRVQEFDFEVKPPDEGFLKQSFIEYSLIEGENGTLSLQRTVASDDSGGQSASKIVCEGIIDAQAAVTIERTMTLSSNTDGLLTKEKMAHFPYSDNGKGPWLLHVQLNLTKPDDPRTADKVLFEFKTCFALRGKLNGVFP